MEWFVGQVVRFAPSDVSDADLEQVLHTFNP
jgi:hypothetical protein